MHGTSHTCYFFTLGAYYHCTRHRKGRGHTNKFSFLTLLSRLNVLFFHINTFHDNRAFFWKCNKHFSLFARIIAGNYFNSITFVDLHSVTPTTYTTSSASEIILMYPRSRNSRATGPKIRPPFGSNPSTMTPALSSNRIYEPSLRR